MDFKQRMQNDPIFRSLVGENDFLKDSLKKLSRQLQQRDTFDMLLGNALNGACANPNNRVEWTSEIAAQTGKTRGQVQGEANAYEAWCSANALVDLLNAKAEEAVDQAEAAEKAAAEEAERVLGKEGVEQVESPDDRFSPSLEVQPPTKEASA